MAAARVFKVEFRIAGLAGRSLGAGSWRGRAG
jgi:hypothetical protein